MSTTLPGSRTSSHVRDRMSNVIWESAVEGYRYRIIQLNEEDCMVEGLNTETGEWVAPDDDSVCADVYMRAFLETRKTLASAIKLSSRGEA